MNWATYCNWKCTKKRLYSTFLLIFKYVVKVRFVSNWSQKLAIYRWIIIRIDQCVLVLSVCVICEKPTRRGYVKPYITHTSPIQSTRGRENSIYYPAHHMFSRIFFVSFTRAANCLFVVYSLTCLIIV